MLLKGADGGIMNREFSELLEFCGSEVNTVKVGATRGSLRDGRQGLEAAE